MHSNHVGLNKTKLKKKKTVTTGKVMFDFASRWRNSHRKTKTRKTNKFAVTKGITKSETKKKQADEIERKCSRTSNNNKNDQSK